MSTYAGCMPVGVDDDKAEPGGAADRPRCS